MKSYFKLGNQRFETEEEYLEAMNGKSHEISTEDLLSKLGKSPTYLGEDKTVAKFKAKEGAYPYPLRPIFNRALIQREEAEKKSASGLILSVKDTKHLAPAIGIVLDVGGTCDDPVKELKGKRVMFSRFAGDWLKFPGVEEEYFLCSDEDILGEICY